MKYKLEIVGHYSKPVERQVCEGVYIHPESLTPHSLGMNSKLYQHLHAVPVDEIPSQNLTNIGLFWGLYR